MKPFLLKEEVSQVNSIKMPHTAMVLAAGLGRRMQPLTTNKPKPLIKIGGVPIIDRTLFRLKEADIKRVVINVHYMAHMMEDHLNQKSETPEIIISDERHELLETGGGITKALPLIGADPFFSINSDAIWSNGENNTLEQLAIRHGHEDEIHLLAIKTEAAYGYFGEGYSGKGDFYLREDNSIEWRQGRDYAPYMFGGISLMSPKLFEPFKPTPFSSIEVFKEAQLKGKLFGHVHEGRWYHAGCPKAVGDIETLLVEFGDDYWEGGS